MRQSIEEVSAALKLIRRVEPFGPRVKASDDFLGPLFESYFGKLRLPNLMQKTDYHTLVQFVPEELVEPEIEGKLDWIVEVAALAKLSP
jgi:hypothetical protein